MTGLQQMAEIVRDIKALCFACESREEARAAIVAKHGEPLAKLFDDSPWL